MFRHSFNYLPSYFNPEFSDDESKISTYTWCIHVKYKMSDGRSSRVHSRKKKTKGKKKFLLTSKKCWLIEQSLLPLYQHLVDGYSDKLRDEWKVKVKEESDIEARA